MIEGHKKICILGAGGFAREIFNIYVDLGLEKNVLSYLEENCRQTDCVLNGVAVNDISYLSSLGNDKPLLIGAIGSTKRRSLLEKLEKEGFSFDTVVHPSVIRSRWVRIGTGSIVTAGVILTCQVEIGKHIIINLGSHIGHDVQIGDFTTLSPGSEVMGNVTLGKEVYVGTNATIIEHVRVGNGAIIAAGAVVTNDVPNMSLVAGVPAEVKKIYKSSEEKPW